MIPGKKVSNNKVKNQGEESWLAQLINYLLLEQDDF